MLRSVKNSGFMQKEYCFPYFIGPCTSNKVEHNRGDPLSLLVPTEVCNPDFDGLIRALTNLWRVGEIRPGKWLDLVS